MALSTNQPITRDGKVYDKLAPNLALSPMQHPDGFGASIAVQLTPYCLGPEGPEKLDDEARAMVYGDAVEAAASDPDLAVFLAALEAAAQRFIDAKGL